AFSSRNMMSRKSIDSAPKSSLITASSVTSSSSTPSASTRTACTFLKISSRDIAIVRPCSDQGGARGALFEHAPSCQRVFEQLSVQRGERRMLFSECEVCDLDPRRNRLRFADDSGGFEARTGVGVFREFDFDPQPIARRDESAVLNVPRFLQYRK